MTDQKYDNIKSHKKPGFHPLFRRYCFRKTTREGGGGTGGVQVDPLPLFPAVLGLNTIRHICSLYIQPLRFFLNLGLFIING